MEGEKLPIAALFPDVAVPDDAVEGSRLVIDERFRARSYGFAISMAMYRALYFQGTSMGIEEVYAVTEVGLLDHLKWMGFPFKIVSAESRWIPEYNSENVAVRFDLSRMYDAAKAGDLDGRGMSGVKLAPFYALGRHSAGAGRFTAQDLGPQHSEMFCRNLAFLGRDRQERVLADAVVSIAGVGGDGGRVATGLARMGVGTFRLADPDHFAIENLNRQEGSNFDTLGRNKGQVIAEAILNINPWANVEVYPEGVTAENVKEFVEGCSVLVDETDFERHEIGVLLARRARACGVPTVMAINFGFGAQVTSFDPAGYPFERYLGLDANASLESIRDSKVRSYKWVAYLPPYLDPRTFAPINRGDVPAPSVAPGVDAAASIAVSEVVKHLIDDRRFGLPVFAPRTLVFDAVAGVFETRRFRTLGYAASLARLGLRFATGRGFRVDV